MEESADRLREVVSECDAALLEGRDSADPVAQRRVDEALREKARALGKLGRDAECVEVWTEMVARVADEPPGDDPFVLARLLLNTGVAQHRSGQGRAATETVEQVLKRVDPDCGDVEARLILGRALSLKREVLRRVGRLAEAGALDSEIIRRLAHAVEPELRERVAFALARRAARLLSENRVGEALADSDELIRRWYAEDEAEAIERVAELLLGQARSFLEVGGRSLGSVMRNITMMFASAAGEGVRFAAQQSRLTHVPGVAQAQAVGGRATSWVSRTSPAVAFALRRRRFAQALAISRAITARFQIDDTLERQQIVATARIYQATATMGLGRLREGFRGFNEIVDGGQEAVAEAFRRQAVLDSGDGLVNELASVANLAQRARTLGQGDPRIARIAFDESMRPGSGDSHTVRTRGWLARLVGP